MTAKEKALHTGENMESDTPTPLTDEMVDVQRTMGGDEYQVVPADFARRLERRCAALEALLREWLITELDSMDEEFEPWIEGFTARITALLENRDGS